METLLYKVYTDKKGTIIYRNAEGKLHRTDGPAVEWSDGSKEFWINGKKITKKEFLKRTTIQEFSMDEIAEKLGIPVELLKIKK